jgi:hypothetical protein
MHLGVTVDQFQERLQEGDQPLCRRGPRTQWRRAEQDPCLQVLFGSAEQGERPSIGDEAAGQRFCA